jgi:Domain of unknown function (DUF5004)
MIHRNISKITAFALTAFLLATCKPDIEGELGAPRDVFSGMAGTWKLEQFIQQDPNNPILEERDLSEFYIVDGIEPMTLNLNSSDFTYTVDITQGKNFLGTSGTWGVDNTEAPSQLMLYGEDTLTLNLSSMIFPYSTNMSLQYHRSCSDGFKNAIYKFNFKRAQ